MDIMESIAIKLFIEELEHVAELYKTPTGADCLIDTLRERGCVRLRRYLRRLHGQNFTAALELTKEMIPGHYNDALRVQNF